MIHSAIKLGEGMELGLEEGNSPIKTRLLAFLSKNRQVFLGLLAFGFYRVCIFEMYVLIICHFFRRVSYMSI